ncbi:hypothetical protein AB6A40_008213 [Gnathostoma spinigerum]|uniref:Uncharacterized protein n=1 Tax=Gnathostoma spinigerum TaxID=75299 RepID=A0ABD6ETK3_9BILA
MMLILVLFFIILSLWLLRSLYLDKLQIENLSDRAVLITGCRTGFGRGLVEKCLREGMTVFAGCHTQQVRYFQEWKL